MNKMAGIAERAAANVARMALSKSPRCPADCHSPSEPLTKGTLAEPARAVANVVFPVSGGPKSRAPRSTALQGIRPEIFEIADERHAPFQGFIHSGKVT